VNDVAVRFSRIDDPAAATARWTDAAARAGRLTWFQTAEWMGNVLAAAPAGTLRLIEGAGGLALYGMSSDPARGRMIWFAETGEHDLDAVCTEYNDVLLSPEAPDGARRVLVAALVREHPEVARFIFRRAAPALKAAVEEVGAGKGFHIRTVAEAQAFEIDLADLAGKPYLETLSSGARSQIRRAERLYAERGEVRLERVAPGGLEGAWAELVAFQKANPREREFAFDLPGFAAFHERLRARGAMVDMLRLSAGETALGVLYNLKREGRVANYQSGFLFEDDNRLKPGLLAHAKAAQFYADEGCAVYDLLAGDEGYKARLAKPATRLDSVMLERPGLRADILAFARRFR